MKGDSGDHICLPTHLSISPSVCSSTHLSIHLPIYLSPTQFTCLSNSQFTFHPSIHACIYPCIHPSILLSTYFPFYSSTHPLVYSLIHLPIHPSNHLLTYLPIYLSTQSTSHPSIFVNNLSEPTLPTQEALYRSHSVSLQCSDSLRETGNKDTQSEQECQAWPCT